VELLLVLCILGLVVTILIPAYSRGIELSRSAVCKGNLHDLAAWLHTVPYEPTGPDLPEQTTIEAYPRDVRGTVLPKPKRWSQLAYMSGQREVMYCPSAERKPDRELSLRDVYVRQDGGTMSETPGVVITNLADALYEGMVNDTQVFYTYGGKSNGSYGGGGWDWVYGLYGDQQPEDNQAMVMIATCAAFLITFEDDRIEFRPLGHSPGWNSGSKHWVCKGDPYDSDGWEGDVLVRLTGTGYDIVNPPVDISHEIMPHYGMNDLVPQWAYWPGQLWLVEYSDRLIHLAGSEPDVPFDEDLSNGEVMDRHLGRANFVKIDGSVDSMTKDELRVEFGKLNTEAESLWRR